MKQRIAIMWMAASIIKKKETENNNCVDVESVSTLIRPYVS